MLSSFNGISCHGELKVLMGGGDRSIITARFVIPALSSPRTTRFAAGGSSEPGSISRMSQEWDLRWGKLCFTLRSGRYL